MNRFIYRTLISLAFLGTFNIEAQEKKIWTLEECVEYALQNNIDVRHGRINIEQAKNEVEAAWANLFPNLNANFGYNFNFGLNIDPVTNLISREQRQTSNLGLNSQWTIFDGFQNTRAIDRSRIQQEINRARYEEFRNEVSLNVVAAYLQILVSKEVVHIAKEQIRISELQVKRMADLVKAGAEPRGSLYELEAQLARDEQNLVANENDLIFSMLNLTQLLQLPDYSNFEVTEPLMDIPEADFMQFTEDHIFARALEIQPNIRRANLDIQRSEKELQMAKGQGYPTLSLIGNINTNYSNQIVDFDGLQLDFVQIGQTASGEAVFAEQMIPTNVRDKPFLNQAQDNVNEFFGISMQIPIYSRLQIRNSIRNARLEIQRSELEYEREVNTLRQNIQRAHADAKASLKSYYAATKAEQSSEEAFKYAQERFQVGAIQQYDFENAKNALAAARSQKISSLYEFIFKVKVLHFYTNNELPQD